MSNTLVIHPDDRSTDFLKPIYKGWNYDVLTAHHDDLHGVLPKYDRVLMLGHGCSEGLFGVGKFKSDRSGLVINSDHVPVLSGKNNVYIWCFASAFVDKYKLSGFTTGMFISEVVEAAYMDVDATQSDIDYSNDLFSWVMNRHIDDPDWESIVSEYDGSNPVVKYNRGLMSNG
jgi:hypothetical protein